MAIIQTSTQLNPNSGNPLVVTITCENPGEFADFDTNLQQISIQVASRARGGVPIVRTVVNRGQGNASNILAEVSSGRFFRFLNGEFRPDRNDIRIELLNDAPQNTYDITVELELTNIGLVQYMPPNALRVAPMQTMTVSQPVEVQALGVQRVSLQEPNREPTGDQTLWVYIRNGVLDFERYNGFINELMNDDPQVSPNALGRRAAGQMQRGRSLLFRTDAYDVLKQATDFYMTRYFSASQIDGPGGFDDEIDNTFQQNRARPDEIANEGRRTRRTDDLSVRPGNAIGYFQQVLNRLGQRPQFNPDLFPEQLRFGVGDLTLLELIWSYWHEEGGLVQTMNAISMRFQNVRGGNGHDPLASLNIDPLRPLNNLIWGYMQGERFRLSLAQRNFEYQYEYGLSLIGRAVPNVAVAESRSQFIPAFHNLLKAATDFYLQANYTTVIPDGFPILNHLREVHLVLAEGAHNSYGDLPYTARAEMLTQQWILARPEMREFLGGRIMVPYTENWMDRVDTMKTLQGWNPANITHFHDLGRFGEQLLLSVRYGAWNGAGTGAVNAANWAHYWREEIQRYLHAYKAVTGVDLAADVTDARISMPQQNERYEQPAVLMNRRANALPAGQGQLGFGALTRQRTLRENR